MTATLDELRAKMQKNIKVQQDLKKLIDKQAKPATITTTPRG